MTSRDRKEVPLRSVLVLPVLPCRSVINNFSGWRGVFEHFPPNVATSGKRRPDYKFDSSFSNFFPIFSQFLGNNNSWLLFLWMILTLQLLIIHKLIRGQVKWTVVSLSLACLHLERLPQNVKQELCWRNCGQHFGVFIHVIVIFDRGNFTRINTVNAVPLPQQHRPEMNYHSISPINNWRIDLFDLFIGFLIYYSEVGGTLLRIVESITTRRIVLHRNRIIDRKIHRCHIHLLSHYLTD